MHFRYAEWMRPSISGGTVNPVGTGKEYDGNGMKTIERTIREMDDNEKKNA